MNAYKLCESEKNFANIIWEQEPIGSGELVRICGERFDWKKSTTYTVLKKLCERGLFCNENATVTAVVKKEDFDAQRAERFIEDSFDSSLPMFLTAFLAGRKLSPREAREIKELIENYEGV